MKTDDARYAGTWTWWIIALQLLLFAALQPSEPIAIDRASMAGPALAIATMIAMRLVGLRLALPNLVVAADALLQMTLFTLSGILLSYALAAQAGALWDAPFARADMLLGLDWPSIRSALDRSFAAVWLLTIAYHSLIAQMVLAILVLAAVGKHRELRRLVLAAVLAGLATILASGLLPAVGNLYDAAHYRHLPPSVAAWHYEVIVGLRDGSLRIIDLRQMMGIVTFPSYHAALALLFIWAFRQVPRTRVAGTIWAGLTIVATPISGGHYGVDVLAGLLLGVVALLAAQAVDTRYASPRASSASLIRRRLASS